MEFLQQFENLTAYNAAKSAGTLGNPCVSLIKDTMSCSFDPYVEPGPEMVDLGLSVKWAKCNLGAETETDYGNYYAWGEVETKSRFHWDTYSRDFITSSFTSKNKKVFIKYCKTSVESLFWAGEGPADNLTVLMPEDDAATYLLGEDWRIPTEDDFNELITLPHTLTAKNGIYGCEFTGNGNTLFIPAAGYMSGTSVLDSNSYGNYWSATCGGAPYSKYLRFGNGLLYVESKERAYGYSIRPVKPVN